MREPHEITIGGHKYRLGGLDAIKQLHVYRRLAPIFAGMGGLAAAGDILGTMKAETIDPGAVAALGDVFGQVLETISRLPDAEVNYVLDATLSRVSRHIEGDKGWAPVWVGGALMYEDIQLLQLLELAARVVMGAPGSGGIADFLGGLPSISGAAG